MFKKNLQPLVIENVNYKNKYDCLILVMTYYVVFLKEFSLFHQVLLFIALIHNGTSVVKWSK